MDLGSIVGLVAGLVAIVLTMLLSGFPQNLIVHPQSIFTTVVGSFAALLIANPLERVLGIVGYVRIILNKPKVEYGILIDKLRTLSEKARREGLLALEDDLDEEDEPFLKHGLQHVVDGADPDIIKSMLENEVAQIEERHQTGIKIFEDWAKFAPAFGMIGTLIGLVSMLGSIEDKSSIGVGMSTALMTTLYGAIMANLVFLPAAAKLEDRNKDEILVKDIMIEGILSIQQGDNPNILEEKLYAYLSPSEREKAKSEAELNKG